MTEVEKGNAAAGRAVTQAPWIERVEEWAAVRALADTEDAGPLLWIDILRSWHRRLGERPYYDEMTKDVEYRWRGQLPTTPTALTTDGPSGLVVPLPRWLEQRRSA
jgi:hypothetical protein